MLWILAALSIAQASTPSQTEVKSSQGTVQIRHFDKDEAAKRLASSLDDERLRAGEFRFDIRELKLTVGLVDKSFGRGLAGGGVEATWTKNVGPTRHDDNTLLRRKR